MVINLNKPAAKYCRLIFGVIFFGFTSFSHAQSLFQLKYLPIYGITGMTTCYNLGLNVNIMKVGFEFDYARSYKKNNPHYNGTFRFRFAQNGVGDERQKSHYLNIGYTYFSSMVREYEAVDAQIGPPSYDSTESNLVYTPYKAISTAPLSYFNIGYENIMERHEEISGGVVQVLFLDPFGFVVGTGSYKTGDVTIAFTRTLYASLSLSNASALDPRISTYEGPNKLPPKPGAQMQLEPLYKNLMGFKTGVSWCTLKPFGFSFGIESGIMPGVYQFGGDYGDKFPEENIYFIAKFGFAIGFSTQE